MKTCYAVAPKPVHLDEFCVSGGALFVLASYQRLGVGACVWGAAV